uniref:Prolyl endopeptidase n=1 Tax=Oryza meridionalis TaxID=40149 RepID=A0A0E0ET50_9ORYZ
MLRRRHHLPAVLRLFSTSCRRGHPTQPPRHPSPAPLPLPLPPPVAKKVPFTASAHGRSWSDPYHWMRDTSDPDLAALLEAENAYADAFVDSAGEGGGGLRARLAAEMRARLPPSAASPPQPWGPWLYYQYVPEGKEYPVLSRRLRSSGGLARAALDFISGSKKEQVLLDWNEIAEKFGYVHIGSCRISPDHRFLAYTLDISGDEFFSLEVKDIQSTNTIFSSPHKGIVYVMESGHVRGGLWPVQKRSDKVQYFLEHHNGFFYILTNAPLEGTETANGGYYLARCRAEKSEMDKWQVVALPGSDYTFQDMDIFHEQLVLFIRKSGLPLICSINLPIDVDFQEQKELDDLDPWFFPVPSDLCSIVPGSNNDFMSSTYRLVVSSPVLPDLTVDYNMRMRTFAILHQEEVTGLSTNLFTVGLQSNITGIQQNLQLIEDSQSWSDLSKLFSCERVQVISHDGVSVPLVILYSREAHRRGESPGVLYGYGAYGEDLDKSWCSDRLSLLARGWVVAFADVRGGGDSSWHLAGTKANKINSIKDFAACGTHLIKEGFVHKNRLCAIGCSAGGLLVGAVINMLPDLFSAAVLKVPFLDICNTMMDSTLPLTILDYEEFGDPNISTEFDTIHSYSPYDNLSPDICYPPVLVTASFNDTRVGVWEAAKWVSKVRDITCQSCSWSVILKTNMQSGHFGEGGRFMHCDETAFEYAFLMKALGLDDNDRAAK